MKVILLQDVEKIGKQYEVKEVAQGHAMNFLIPKGLVKPATEESLKWLAVQKEILRVKAEEDLKKAQALATSLDGQEIVITIKAGEEKQLFEAVSAQKIAEKLKENGFEVKKTQVILENPIKELGEFPVKIRFSHNLEAEIKVIVIEEKK
ncbi:MAG: 50S ribosomal protein L9 [Candidatus Nealsonbacteria bacterium RIFCSPLOWO2_01_FULL_43_32]|uniref:Large ribosomal subunit protein bL9 n=1 Tax=Candidatus Nealsonbacteria bacterium RIFCSPLOWO2_01_FULL_43_32 TaxID=1801672 RepID=A0A1G2EH39_9BACT|nr:MAG: 50S ribosomal protein L9 [Candidatus Nealsonbacteria bacterium RIFCSPLOWO2_01_FULL_43_32]